MKCFRSSMAAPHRYDGSDNNLQSQYNDFADNKIKYILNLTTTHQLRFVVSLIKQSLELRTGGLLITTQGVKYLDSPIKQSLELRTPGF